MTVRPDLVSQLNSHDAAVCVFRFDCTGVIDGEPASGQGRGASVFRRGPFGWQVVHENLSSGAWK
jgi:ketosteroid isomerase-like protein